MRSACRAGRSLANNEDCLRGEQVPRIAVSACLLGEACKYNGGSNRHDGLVETLASSGCEVVPVCPEVAGGLPTPRPRSELRNGVVVNEFGESVDCEFRQGAAAELARVEEAGGIDAAILQPRSPSCGKDFVYDGTFSGKLVPGDGVFAGQLKARGVPVFTPEEYLERF